VLRRDYLPEELQPLLQVIGFDGTIAVQARQRLEETEWLLKLAEEHDFIKGVVGWVDLRSPELHGQLERYAKHPQLAGVRHVLHDEPNDHFMRLPEFRRGIAQLREFGLTYDLLLFPKHLPVAVELVAEFPAQPFVLDHIAKPAIREGQVSPWREDLMRLAQFPNVLCKLSGMVTEAKWNQWRPEDFHRYLEVVFEAFGPDRLMIGSDWPVCTLSGSYTGTMVSVIARFVAAYDDFLDDADMRRGTPTLHRSLGPKDAVLAGDWLFSTCFNLAAESASPENAKSFSRGSKT
jgi:L-fuconolactonase